MSALPHWESVDDATGDLLDLIQSDWRPFADRDRNTVARAIRDDAEAHDGHVSPNRVRATLAALPILEQPKPQRVGPVYRALALLDLIRADGFEVSDDLTGRNSGRPSRTYRWISTDSPAAS